jgi:hypothetical protein
MLGQRIVKLIMVSVAGTSSVEALKTNIKAGRIILLSRGVSRVVYDGIRL